VFASIELIVDGPLMMQKPKLVLLTAMDEDALMLPLSWAKVKLTWGNVYAWIWN